MSDEQHNRRCGTCRHWDGAGDQFGLCNGVPHLVDIKAGDLAFVTDSDDNATLHTRAAFGCVLWEA